MRQVKYSTEVSIAMDINMPPWSVSNFHAEHTVLNVPGANYAVTVSHAYAPTGGGEDNSIEVTWVVLGNWAAPAIEKYDDGAERISLTPVFDKAAPLLSMQNLRIRIGANAELAQTVLRQMDLGSLTALMRH